ncbi:putative uncharacterized protein [Waddlia chondrophila 2032/99]|uniref:Uncharacterized protein n=2 Tax=Waddlia chondrophila TaxID=71667 RepID=D6YWU4_WADCW|nr:hypothetical protein [Waddlia chondrophila]ADI38605.1 hypothetical protein wcw_1248 [Waddlia chondrophila WSU 86-1044]CCB91693.1 putative uncharacterized protein [Waddlia chondrophila 2032/99]
MSLGNFEVVGIFGGLYIKDNKNEKIYKVQSSEPKIQVQNADQLLRGALQIIERLEEETVNLSEVSIGSKGVRIGKRFVSKADIENFD